MFPSSILSSPHPLVLSVLQFFLPTAEFSQCELRSHSALSPYIPLPPSLPISLPLSLSPSLSPLSPYIPLSLCLSLPFSLSPSIPPSLPTSLSLSSSSCPSLYHYLCFCCAVLLGAHRYHHFPAPSSSFSASLPLFMSPPHPLSLSHDCVVPLRSGPNFRTPIAPDCPPPPPSSHLSTRFSSFCVLSPSLSGCRHVPLWKDTVSQQFHQMHFSLSLFLPRCALLFMSHLHPSFLFSPFPVISLALPAHCSVTFLLLTEVQRLLIQPHPCFSLFAFHPPVHLFV